MTDMILQVDDFYETENYQTFVKGIGIFDSSIEQTEIRLRKTYTFEEYCKTVAYAILESIHETHDPEDIALHAADVKSKLRFLKVKYSYSITKDKQPIINDLKSDFYLNSKRRYDLMNRAALLYHVDREISYEMYIHAAAIATVTNELIENPPTSHRVH